MLNLFIIGRDRLLESEMIRTISSSDLRARIKQVLSEVEFGRAQYVVKKFGQPAAAIVSMEDFRLLQAARDQQQRASLHELLAQVRARSRGVDPGELDALVEEARAAFYQARGR